MKNLKRLFPIFANNPDLVYLDTGASAQKPAAVIDGMKDFLEHSYANIHRGLYGLSLASSAMYDDARRRAAAFIGADAKEIVFTKGTTEAINLLASSFGADLKPGDEIMTTEIEHHSNMLPWREAARRAGANLKYIPAKEDGSLDYSWLEKNISGRAKMVAATGQSNVIGLATDIARIARAAHAAGAKVFIDAAQLAVHERINARELDIDFLAFSSHKVYGPTGFGALYGKRGLLEALPPYQFGGDMVESVALDSAKYKASPEKFEAGTTPIVEACGFGLALDFLSEIGMENVSRETKELTEYAISRLSAMPGVRFISHRDSNGIVSFAVDGASAFDIGTLLGEKGVCVRVGRHCAEPLHAKFGAEASVRISLGLYNDADDIDRFIAALEKALATLRG